MRSRGGYCSLSPEDIAACVHTVLTARSGMVFPDITLTPQKHNNKVISASTIVGKVKHEIDDTLAGIRNIADATQEMQNARNTVVDVVQNLTAIGPDCPQWNGIPRYYAHPAKTPDFKKCKKFPVT